MKPTKSEKGQHVYFKRGNLFSYVDFTRLCSVISHFPELSPEFLTNGITFHLSKSKIAM